jgi:hypothetical protein
MTKFGLLIIISLLILACNASVLNKAEADFRTARPNTVLITHGVGEGDTDTVYIYFRFRRPPSNETLEEIWQYQRNDSGQWILVNDHVPK